MDEAPWWVATWADVEPWTDADLLTHAATRPAGVALLADLLQVNPRALSADDAVTYAQQADRFVAFAAGFQAVARAEAQARLVAHSDGAPAERSRGFVTAEQLASAELAAALRVTPRSMDRELELATDLAGPMAPLRTAMLAGLLSARHAAATARELTRLPLAADSERAEEYAAQCAQILAIVVPYAATHTPGETARRTRALVLAMDRVGAAERRRDAAEREHGVWLTPREAGSCEITAVLPIGHGAAVMNAITTLARDPRFETADACITAGQRRVAALIALTLGDPGTITTIDGPVAEAKTTVTVDVVIPLATLARAGHQGGTIAGEPVTDDVITDLIAEADPASTLRRLVVDTAGCIVDAGRTRYAISDVQRRLVALRDGTCRFPGCSRPAERCEIDHATPWDSGGPTDLANLGALCKHHHQLKTFGRWRITGSQQSGACTWRSPLGRVYSHDPPGLVPPDAEPPDPVVPTSQASAHVDALPPF